jgi:NAD(P)H dehydrogenase (quinone)
VSTHQGPEHTALVVHAHPEPASFSTAQARTAVAALHAVGYNIEYLDLYAKQWAPVLDRDEFGPVNGPFKPQREQWDAFRAGSTLAADVRADLDAVFRAELLVLSFPLWWFSFPAILKGWLDRVFAMGAVSGGDAGLFETAALRGRRAVVLTTTGGPAAAFAPDGVFGGIDEFLFPINRGVLEFVGYDALEPIVTFGPAHLDDAARRDALDTVRTAITELHDRPLASTNRSRRLADTH